MLRYELRDGPGALALSFAPAPCGLAFLDHAWTAHPRRLNQRQHGVMRGLNDNAGVVAGAKQRNVNGATEIRFAGAPGLADRGQNPITGLCATAAHLAADPALVHLRMPFTFVTARSACLSAGLQLRPGGVDVVARVPRQHASRSVTDVTRASERRA